MSLLTIVNKVQALANLPVTSTVATNTGDAQVQLLAIVNAVGEMLMSEHDWQTLITESSFTTTATEQQTNGLLPTDCDRVLNDTLWNRTTTDPVLGPVSSQLWQSQKANVVTTVWSQYRIKGNYFYFLPAPAAGQSIYYEYISNKWATDSTGATGKTALALDSDLSKFPERLMWLGTLWRWLEAKGFDYTQRFNEYEAEKSKVFGRDGTRRIMSAAGPMVRDLGRGKIKEGSW